MVQDNPPDARLTELLRTSAPTAYPALQELRARHHPAVLGYARLCTAGDAAARRLTAQTFTTAARDIARGTEPAVPLRHHLLLLAVRLAAEWSHDERSAALDPTLLLVLNSTGAAEPPAPPLLAAFQSLPSRTQGLIWYGVLDQELPARTAAHLGLTPEDVRYGTPPALQSLAQACLRSRLAASDDSRCADFRRLIEESVRPEHPRHSADLHAHMARCPHCTAAFEDLTALRDSPRTALAEGLLPWGGTAYCLDSRGSVDKGVGIWQCSSVDGDNGDNLRFTVASDGEIRPAIAIETALTPNGDDQLSLAPVNGGAAQRWRAGAS